MSHLFWKPGNAFVRPAESPSRDVRRIEDMQSVLAEAERRIGLNHPVLEKLELRIKVWIVLFFVKSGTVGQDQHAGSKLPGGKRNCRSLKTDPGVKTAPGAVRRGRGRILPHQSQTGDPERQHEERGEENAPPGRNRNLCLKNHERSLKKATRNVSCGSRCVLPEAQKSGILIAVPAGIF